VRWRLAAFAALIVVAVVAAIALDLPSAADVRQVVDAYGAAAPLVFVAGYAVVTLAPVPKNVLSAAAGLMFGLGVGVGLVWLGALAGALMAFGIGRLLGRDVVERLTSTRVRRVDDLIARRGLLTVVLVRLVPVVPFTAINYTAGLTGIRLWQYVVGTAVGILPGTVAYVALGSYGASPRSWQFLLSAALLVALSVGGLLAARRRRSRHSDLEQSGVRT
jgi:uncharacterized membrane protein YdjX (TVP38/TMEM64 family)